jgi:hypothetical protein
VSGDDDGYAISYKVLARGTPVHSSDGVDLGTVSDVLEARREHIFDGIVIDTPHGPRWVDAPEVARIAERRVTLTIDAATAAELPERDPKGSSEFRADARSARLPRLFGGGWRRRK